MAHHPVYIFSRYLLPLLLLSPVLVGAQSGLWTEVREADISAQLVDRQVIPDRYRTLRLDLAQLRALLNQAPAEQDYLDGAPALQVPFPLPDGRMGTFGIWEAPVMAPELCAQFPEIRSYAGKSESPAGILARFDISPAGLHAMFLNTPAGSAFIDPYARGNTADYICYFKKDFVKRIGDIFDCQVDDQSVGEEASDRFAGSCGNLRQYRLALACTGEYANFHGSFGSNKAPALAAMNTSMTRVNGVYERDASIRMVIVANDTAIIYTNPSTDPYTNGNGSTMLGQNQTTCTNVIGSANYDIGHVFSTGGGGVANLSCVCNSSFKARGVTGSPSPVGDPFDIDYVAHEMGHQFGGNHTQYNNCNRNNATAMEPGSASTIMGYAGICSPNVQSNSDDYFHAINLQEIAAFVGGSGGSCATLIANGNSAPSLPNLTNRNIPKSTPFVLSATATDPNGDPLTYCWEQMDGYSNPAQNMPPQSNNTTGPMFRSLSPVSETARYFPNFDDVLANINSDWEELPSIGRTMNFRLTVRDNHANGGCTTEKSMTVTTSASIGPFLVSVPNGGETYDPGSTHMVSWDVAGTTGPPVNCAQVDILLSTDGGASFSALVSNTPNDGSESITFPNLTTNAARILIQSVGNIFYDVSDQNFSIAGVLPVEWSVFNARFAGGAVRLDWTTESEKNNRGFYVERSSGNAFSFQSVGWVNGHGTSAERRQYGYVDTDIQPGQVYYYRLRQVDYDGRPTLSDVQAVSVGSSAGGSLGILPNPASGQIELKWDGTETREATWQLLLTDASGRVIRDQAWTPDTPEVQVSDLPRGIYQVQLIGATHLLQGRFFKW